ncbi:MAG: PDZ domain-containing protein [Oscillospiraceae bacterium]|nr:PDZ domain-containing protein [Oscillospiraceae bacterium]
MKRLFRRVMYNLGSLISAFFNIGISLKFVILVCVILTAGTYFITNKVAIDNVGGAADYAEAMRYIEIKDIVDEKFIDTVDRGAMGDSAAAAMVAGLGDKWSYYMSSDEYKTYQLYSSDEYSDIGLSIMKDDSGGYQVISVNPGSPAAWAGLTPGMVITDVDGEDVTVYDADYVRQLIRGKLNTVFTLGINRGQSTITVDCTGFYVSPVSYRMEKTEAGYIKIDNFEAGSGQDAINAIEDLLSQKAVALCIDVRGNPGGLKNEIAKLLDYLLPKGMLFSEVDKEGNRNIVESDGMCVQIPIVVLLNTETYSEAELFAAVLQEYNWALLMGEPTSGRTRTQSTVELADGSAIRLSTKTYLTPNGNDISASGGVVPDSIVFNTDASATGTTEGTTGVSDGTASTSADDQLMAALKYLS